MKKPYKSVALSIIFMCCLSGALAKQSPAIHLIIPKDARIIIRTDSHLPSAHHPVLFVGDSLINHIRVEKTPGYRDHALTTHTDKKLGTGLSLTHMLYEFRLDDSFRPYVVTGLGYYQTKNTPLHQDLAPAAYVGGVGGEVFLSDTVIFHGDIRDIYSASRGKQNPWLNLGIRILFP